MDRSGFIEKLVKWHQLQFPETVRLRKVGLEKELPVVAKNTHKAADGRRLFPELIKAGWQPRYDDVNNSVMLGVTHPLTGIEITTEAGFCTLELIMPPEDSIGLAIMRLDQCEKMVSHLARKQGMLVLAYGIQPKSSPDKFLWISKRRHQVIRQVLPPEVDVVTITAADQVHLDISREELVDAVNVFNALSGLIIHLFANSPVWQGDVDTLNRLAVREDLWVFAPQERMGIHAKPYEDLFDYLSAVSGLGQFLCKENGDYSPVTGSYLDYVIKNPEIDWQYHWQLLEGMIWPNARARTPYGTIEIRPACTSSIEGTAALVALCLGVLENLAEVKALINRYPWHFWQKERARAISGIKEPQLVELIGEILDLAKAGLQKRELGEEVFLNTLYSRLARQTNPARIALGILQRKGWDGFIKSIAI